MTTDVIKLLTEIVVFAAAAIGLYKAARYVPKKQPSSEAGTEADAKRKSPQSSVWGMLLSMAGVFGFMLLFPLFILGFTYVTSLLGKVGTTTYNTTVAAPELPSMQRPDVSQMSEVERNLYLILDTATQITSDSSARNGMLTKSVDFAAANHYDSVALELANAVTNDSNLRNRNLSKVVDAAKDDHHAQIAVQAVALIASDTNIKTREAQAVVDWLLQDSADKRALK